MAKNKKNIVEQLKNSLERMESNYNYEARERKEIEAKFISLEEKFNAYRSNIEGQTRIEREHNRELLEIIRWKINPNSTNFPFKAEKSQIKDNERGIMGAGGYSGY